MVYLEHPEIREAMEEMTSEEIKRLAFGIKCPLCGRDLINSAFKYYPHEGGIKPLDFGGRWWIYWECKCGDQIAWWKLWNRRKQQIRNMQGVKGKLMSRDDMDK